MLDIYNELYEDIDEELIDDSNMFDVDEQDIEDDILLEAEDDYDEDEYMDNLASQLENQLPYGYEAYPVGHYITVHPEGNRSAPSLEINTRQLEESTIEFNDTYEVAFDDIDKMSVYLTDTEDYVSALQNIVQQIGEQISTYVDIFNSYVEMTK